MGDTRSMGRRDPAVLGAAVHTNPAQREGVISREIKFGSLDARGHVRRVQTVQ